MQLVRSFTYEYSLDATLLVWTSDGYDVADDIRDDDRSLQEKVVMREPVVVLTPNVLEPQRGLGA
jgi:hypothetical protein